MSVIHMTYTGSCKFNNQVFLCSNMNASLDQKLLFYDHIVGLRDVISTSENAAGSKKGESGVATNNRQKMVYRYSPAIAKASFSGPIPVENFEKIFNAAIRGDTVEVEMVFWETNAPSVTIGNAKIETFTIDLKAGEIATFSVGLTGAEYKFSEGSSSEASACQRLLTWDACAVSVSEILSDISTFQMTINNPVVPIYTTRWTEDEASGGLMPQKIRIGIQEVSGSLGIYSAKTIDVPTSSNITVKLAALSKTFKAGFGQPKDDASGGPYVRTIMFTGVNDGDVWQS